MFYNGYDPMGGMQEGAGSAEARHQARQANSDVQHLQERLERLELVCEALWELLKSRMNVTDDQLMGWMAELDLADGVPDGKRAKGPTRCSSCDRPNSPRHQNCIYCGTQLKTTPFG